MNMQITELTVHPTNDGLVRAYVTIVFDNCLKVEEIRVIQGPTALFVSFPAKKQRDGSDRQLAYPANAEARMMFQRVILAEYEKLVGKEESVPTVRSAAESMRALGQLKTDDLINEGEYNSKRKEILGEFLVVPSSPVPERVCPKCSSEYVKRASRVGLERLMSLFYIYPFRCQPCGHRFRLFQWGVTYTRIELDSRAAQKRRLTWVR
jgi:DNA-binding cell septation regulator SpoVG